MTEKAKTFYDWILQFTKEDSPIGDLARDIYCANCVGGYWEFPKCKTKGVISEYLSSNNASPECLHAFDEAWELYKNYKKEHHD